jgi:selenocysteine lyase/cysteine desulfurase
MMDQSFTCFRELFPAYSEGIYVNHAAVSPLSTVVRQTLLDFWDKRSRLPVDAYPEWMGEINRFKAAIAGLIRAKSPERIAMVPNTSYGLNLITTGLEWKAGHRILLCPMEFQANLYPFLNLERHGVHIDWIEPEGGEIRPDDVEKKVTPHTRLLSISFVQYLNGFRADLEAIGRVCRKHGVLFIVDGIQGAGAVPVDVEECGIDAFVCGGHKWLMWPMGTGFLHTGEKLLGRLKPGIAGWMSAKNRWDFGSIRLEFADSAEKLEPGTMNIVGILAGQAMLERMTALGIESIYERILGLTDRLIDGLQNLPVQLITPAARKCRSGIVSFKVENPDSVIQKLEQNGIFASMRKGAIRLSPHCTNTMEEMDRILECLRKIL